MAEDPGVRPSRGRQEKVVPASAFLPRAPFRREGEPVEESWFPGAAYLFSRVIISASGNHPSRTETAHVAARTQQARTQQAGRRRLLPDGLRGQSAQGGRGPLRRP